MITLYFSELLQTGELQAGSFALYHKGELVVEVYGGYSGKAKWNRITISYFELYTKDEENRVEWQKNTLGRLFSSTKALAAVTIAVLVDRYYLLSLIIITCHSKFLIFIIRGLLNYDERVAKYWPEFAQNGKDQITLRQLISHQVSLSISTIIFTLSKVYTY